jgi:hypothetical protein
MSRLARLLDGMGTAPNKPFDPVAFVDRMRRCRRCHSLNVRHGHDPVSPEYAAVARYVATPGFKLCNDCQFQDYGIGITPLPADTADSK